LTAGYYRDAKPTSVAAEGVSISEVAAREKSA
jgi:hypothetical protein